MSCCKCLSLKDRRSEKGQFLRINDCIQPREMSRFLPGTMVQKNQEYRRKYWATRSSVCIFAHSTISFACSTLLYPHFATLVHLHASLLTHSLPSSWESEWLDGWSFYIVFCSEPLCPAIDFLMPNGERKKNREKLIEPNNGQISMMQRDTSMMHIIVQYHQSMSVMDTMVDNSQEYRLEYWATRSSVRSFARTAHSWDSECLDGYFVCVFFHFRP